MLRRSPFALRKISFASSFALLLALLATAVVAWPPTDTRREARALVRDHEDGRAKRTLAEARALGRASRGRLALHAEGEARGVNVLSYDLAFTVNPAVAYLEGTVDIRLVATMPGISSIALDLDDAYTVVETRRDGRAITPLSFRADQLALPLDPPLLPEERTTLRVAWKGVPPSGGALSFWASSAGAAVTSVAEPFDARTFWPCVDDPSDRAVTTVSATVPEDYFVASAGLHTETPVQSGKRTFLWRFPEPISTYLVSLNVAKYVPLEDVYRSLDGKTTMPVTSYLLPQHAEANRARNLAIKGHIAVLSGIFGEYPFLSSKYGIVEASFSGGMEHPTMTSIGSNLLGNATRDLTLLFVHELAHMWWGDSVTMRTWDDIWLNEGFATYAEVLYLESAEGAAPGTVLTSWYDDGLYSGQLGHSVVVPASDPFRYTGAVYDKGGWVCHMLRKVTGDEAYFAALAEYRRLFTNGNASRGDLRQVYETQTGLDLKQFFDQWLETPFRPVLRGSWQNAADLSTVTVRIVQSQGHSVIHPVSAPSDTSYYRFPLVVRLTHADGSRDDQRLSIDQRDVSVILQNPSHKGVTSITLDPDGDLLKIVEATGPAV